MFLVFKTVILMLICACSAEQLAWQPMLEQQRDSLDLLQQKLSEATVPNNHIASCRGNMQNEQNNAVTVYHEQYARCQQVSAMSLNQLNTQTNAERANQTKTGQDVCNGLKNCENVQDALEFFNCYSKATTDAFTDMNALTANSAQMVNYVNYQTQNITYYEQLCFNDCHYQYMTMLSNATENFKQCLNTVPLVPTLRPPPSGNVAIAVFNVKSTFKLMLLLLAILRLATAKGCR